MTSHIDFRTLPANVPVLCIPRVYLNISEQRIRKIFDDLNMGIIERIDIVSKHVVKHGSNPSHKGERFNRVFIHFRYWNNSENANIARERLLNGKEIKIIYDEPWFWKISAYRESGRMLAIHIDNKATIQFDLDEERRTKFTHYKETRHKLHESIAKNHTNPFHIEYGDTSSPSRKNKLLNFEDKKEEVIKVVK